MIYYISGTGNTSLVAHTLARAIREPVSSLVHPKPFAGTCLGFVFPIHAWGLPTAALKFLHALPSEKRKAIHTFAVFTCGDDIGYADSELRRLLRTKGIDLHAAYSVQMRNTYVSLPGFDVDPPAVEQKKLKAALHRLTNEIIPRLQSDERVTDVERGSVPWLKSYVLRPFFRRFLIGAKGFRVSSACISCGQCVSHCPMGNISLVGGHPKWSDICTDCYACYHVCPMHAIGRGRATQGKGQVKVYEQ